MQKMAPQDIKYRRDSRFTYVDNLDHFRRKCYGKKMEVSVVVLGQNCVRLLDAALDD